MKSVQRIVLVCGLFFLYLPAAMWAQAAFGGIAGTVTDSTGAALPGAKITITDIGKGVGFTTVTNASGNYSRSHLIVGEYAVTIEAPGFERHIQKNVHVEVDAVTQVNAQLTLGKVGEVISVNADEPLLKTEKSDISDTIEQKTIQEIPIYDRDVNRLYFLVPGIQAGGSTTANEQPQDTYRPKVNGAYWGGISFQLDGTDNRESVLGEPVITPKPDALSELKISVVFGNDQLEIRGSSSIAHRNAFGSQRGWKLRGEKRTRRSRNHPCDLPVLPSWSFVFASSLITSNIGDDYNSEDCHGRSPLPEPLVSQL